MHTLRTAGFAACLVVALAGWTAPEARKEMLRLHLSSASGAPVRVHLSARGLIIIPAHPLSGRQQAATDTTISAPADVTLGGVGEAELEVIGPAISLVVEVTQIRQNAPPMERLTGRAFRVTHATYAEPYHVTVVPSTPQTRP